MKRWLQSGVMFAAMLAALPLRAQIKTVGDGKSESAQGQHLKVTLVKPDMATMDGPGRVWAGIFFELDAGWHVYWVNPGDSGDAPHVQWSLPAGVTAEPMQFIAPRRLPLGPLMDFGYENARYANGNLNGVAFPVRLTLANTIQPGTVIHLGAAVSWLVCREVCIPGKALLGADYKVEKGIGGKGPAMLAYLMSGYQTAISEAVKNLPKPLPANAKASVDASGSEYVLTLTTGKRLDKAEVYPFDQGIVANAAPQKLEPLPNGARIHLVKDDTLTHDPAQLHLLVKLSDTLAYDVTAAVSGGGSIQPNAPAAANTMLQPPAPAQRDAVSSVTLPFAIGLAFLGGIILNLMPCVFPVLFLKGLALVRGSGEERRRTRLHGLVYTAGIVVSFWALVALLLALRASGAHLGWGFQLQSPVFIAVLCAGLFFFALSLAGMFDFGLSLTSAGGELAQQPGYAGSFFTGVLATVVATPCTAPLMGAAIGFALAQPGWMAFVIFTAVALGLALPYLLLSLQPSWTRVLPKPGAWMEVLKQLTSLPLFATVIWLAWVYGTLRGLDAMARLLIALLGVAVAAWVMGRWPGRKLAALFAVVLIATGLAVPLAHKEATAASWQPYSDAALAEARAQGKPVFVDFTAAWCLSCHVNEEFVLDSSEVQSKLQSSGLVLMKADWTKYDPAITQALASVGRSGVPTYVIYPAHGGAPDVLPELLSKSVVLNALERDKK